MKHLAGSLMQQEAGIFLLHQPGQYVLLARVSWVMVLFWCKNTVDFPLFTIFSHFFLLTIHTMPINKGIQEKKLLYDL